MSPLAASEPADGGMAEVLPMAVEKIHPISRSAVATGTGISPYYNPTAHDVDIGI